MKKLLIVGCILLLCCCMSCFMGFGLIGYFENAGKCVFRGPLSSVSSGACAVNTSTNTSTPSNSNNQQSANKLTYNGDDYSLEYSAEMDLDNSDSSRLFVYASNGLDNLNISGNTFKISPTQSNCQDYADEAIAQLSIYDAELSSVSVTTVGGYSACKIDMTADYGTTSGVVDQTQYYVAVDGTTYVMTITINSDSSNYASLDMVAKSIKFN